jgi:hypothetical protein
MLVFWLCCCLDLMEMVGLQYEAKGMSTPGCSDDELELVNFFKHRGLSRIMEQVREYQRSRYTSKQVPLATAINLKYTTWFLNTFDRLPEAQRFQFSKMLEPLSTSGEEQLYVLRVSFSSCPTPHC